jgi:uncharacterized DUF497 family protein
VIDLAAVTGFDRDEGSARKNDKHGVSAAAAEQVFFNRPLLAPDLKHSHREQRYHALGQDNTGRRRHRTFTLREGGSKIRVISARDMHRKERLIHDQQG